MTRLVVPRGEPRIPVYQLTDGSPYWNQLKPIEQSVACRTVSERPVMFLAVALSVTSECLRDFRRSRDATELQSLTDRLERVIECTRGGATPEDFRDRYAVPARVRLMLMGAERAEAEQLSKDAVESLLDLYRVGPQRSPRLEDQTVQLDPSAGQQRWRENACWLNTVALLRPKLVRYMEHELRAFPESPGPDPIYAARGPRFRRPVLDTPATGEPPEPIASLEQATQHVERLLWFARSIVSCTTEGPVEANFFTADDTGESALFFWEGLKSELGKSACLAPLKHHLHRLREENYTVASVVEPSVHETIRGLACQVLEKFRQGVLETNTQIESDRWREGPWQGHEVGGALEWFRSQATELFEALDYRGYRTLLADLKRESAKIRSAIIADEKQEPAAVAKRYCQLLGASDRGGKGKDKPGSRKEAGGRPRVDYPWSARLGMVLSGEKWKSWVADYEGRKLNYKELAAAINRGSDVAPATPDEIRKYFKLADGKARIDLAKKKLNRK